MVMIMSALLLLPLVRRLGLAIVDAEQAAVSRGAILKQVGTLGRPVHGQCMNWD